MILTGEHTFGCSHDHHILSYLLPKAQREQVALLPRTEIAEGNPLPARINHGRWIVDCPDCNGAQMVFGDSAAPVTMCPNCWNGAALRRWRRVLFPKDRAEIEAALAMRPLPMNRNWSPGETVADLWHENAENGLLVLPVGNG